MPIESFSSYKEYLREDMKSFGLKRWYPWLSIKYPTLSFQRKLRTAEFLINCAPTIIGRFVGLAFRHRAREAGIRLGFSIPPNVFGPGLCIVHWGTIVVHDKARVGARCRIHPCTLIGKKENGIPVVGDDVYIGNGAKIVGGITVAAGSVIGANAVVTKSFTTSCTLVGAPAKPVVR